MSGRRILNHNMINCSTSLIKVDEGRSMIKNTVRGVENGMEWVLWKGMKKKHERRRGGRGRHGEGREGGRR